ncbi:DUF3108 domain-containing protein [Massilia sp. PWRC2]|uniref:DUF3108 domain-containing protein n=1 Tax=Massilia sp. PWRC2 TaxID=2804626 RepID=UPI003CFB8EF4
MNLPLRPLPFLLRQQRLAPLCAASALLHLAVLAWLAGAAPALKRAAPPLPAPLQVRLAAPVSAARTVPARAPSAASSAVPAAAALARQRARLGAAGSAVRAASAAVPPPLPALTALYAAATGWDVSADGDDHQAQHLPGFQAVQAPPAARLSYAVTTASAGGAELASGAATLEWRLDEHGYSMSMSGVSGVFESRGQMSDSGFAPLSSRQQGADGSIDTVQFDWSAGQASFGRAGTMLTVASDGQDRASMLMRLAGMGLAGAAQLQGVIELQVAGSNGLATVRFERIGDEEVLATGLGPLSTVHLAQLVALGQPRLEVWLAPERAWYPVRLKVTAADGSSATQTVTAYAGTAPLQPQ